MKKKAKAENLLTWVSFSVSHVGLVMLTEFPTALEYSVYASNCVCMVCDV